MVSSIEQKVEYLNKLLDNNSETAKTLKDTLERLDGTITNRIATTASLSPSIGDVGPSQDIDEKYIDLSKENQILNQVVKDYESTLDIIMNKYRLQTKTMQSEKQNLQVQLENDIFKEKKHVQDLMKENKELQEKFNRCISVIREALLVSEESDNDNELLIQSLINENNGLKDMLQINKMNDISNIDLSSAETENKKKN
ncbi:hypothetical protein H8356DRAFT_1025615 [Neocallimastix lanati (nom. inval.)]|uniref:Uncharacterized protein n=1 Tax=Neocallimastix californiae TaxID=1754190 RepID=A0A1Y2CB44_9FUNG|nr:hypothetical protein H8356DRAFT_1025615 [Neocallimastix sp. JGI-2020a]ORY44252.1 hypothetical protein LY90DRAFT_671655 [Neocallimastix californiae]|eukprot:ORY44252.1 hypothetical protein LY90DRAFT_671655 [Neocallimastix californiae]